MPSRPIGRPLGKLLVITAIGALSLGAFAPIVGAADGPVAWQATAGVSTNDQAVQANAFLPSDLTVDVGDTVTWTIASGEFHTVTFLSGAEAPPLIVLGQNGPEFNPAAVAPSGGPAYDGTGIHSSGLLFKGQTYTQQFTTPGTYAFLCLVHAGMAGTLHVQAADTAYPRTQAQIDTQTLVAGNGLRASGRTLEARSLAAARSSGPGLAVVGAGQALPGTGSVAVMRFLPGKLVVHAGDTVTWSNLDPETPHTITFGTEPGGGPLGAFLPSGGDGPGHATIGDPTQSVNSGFIGAGLPFGTSYSATFTTPGTYPFICALHDYLGMTGTIVVVP